MLTSSSRTAATGEGKREEGSVVLAVVVVMVITFSLVATVGMVIAGLNSARNDQSRTNALQQANAGLDQALYRIDKKDLPAGPSGSYVPVVVGGLVVSFTETVASGGSTFEVQAVRDPPGQETAWTVRSTGRDPSGRERRTVASITADLVFPNGFFTEGIFQLTGSQTSPRAYDSSTCPLALVSCELPLPVPARLGTNSVVDGATATLDDFIGSWDGFNMYGRATQQAADEACAAGRCGTAPKVKAVTNRLTTPYPDEPTPNAGCPSGGVIGSNGLTTVIPPGDYVCSNLELRGTIVVGAGGTGTVRFWVRGTFVVQANGVVNEGQRPRQFQVFQKESPGGGTVCNARIWGLLLVPGVEIDCQGSHQPELWGAVVARLHTGTGSHFLFHHDVSSRYDVNYGRYHIENWRECPPAPSDC